MDGTLTELPQLTHSKPTLIEPSRLGRHHTFEVQALNGTFQLAGWAFDRHLQQHPPHSVYCLPKIGKTPAFLNELGEIYSSTMLFATIDAWDVARILHA